MTRRNNDGSPRAPSREIQEHIAANYRYDPETGEFWRRAGSTHPTGYAVVGGTIGSGEDRQRWAVKAHRLAYFFMTGEWPPDSMFIDHVNRDRADNRWSNLRPCSRAENARNRAHWGQVDFRGVVVARGWKGKPVGYRATIGTYPNNKNLGVFSNAEDAAMAYNKAALELYGPFARLNCID